MDYHHRGVWHIVDALTDSRFVSEIEKKIRTKVTKIFVNLLDFTNTGWLVLDHPYVSWTREFKVLYNPNNWKSVNKPIIYF
jgi:hypothetical protein